MLIMRRYPALIFVLATLARADTVVLTDGTTFDGDVKRSGAGFTVTLADGSTHTVDPKNVKSIAVGSAAHGEQGASSSLASLRRAVENLPDIDPIIDRYQRFIDANSSTDAASQAAADLKLWQQRKADHFVHFGGRWISPDAVSAMVNQANDLTEQARDQLRDGNLKSADQTLQNALAIDPQNVAALYLHGIMLYRADKLPEARKSFEALNAHLPNYPPALNNIAVILNRQNASAPALNFYDQAMQAAGPNKYILDNVAQTLGVLSDDQKKSPAYTKALRRFTELDTILQQQMAQKGLFRWGGGWITQKQLDDLKSSEKDVRDQITALQKQFDQTSARVSAIDAQVQSNRNAMADLLSRSSFIDAKGTPVTIPLPQIYYDLQTQNGQLEAERTALSQQIPDLQAQARDLQTRVTKPTFTGVQQIVGVEGMPQIVSAAATQPTTADAPVPD